MMKVSCLCFRADRLPVLNVSNAFLCNDKLKNINIHIYIKKNINTIMLTLYLYMF